MSIKINRHLLSSSSNGEPLGVTVTTPGTAVIVHQAPAGTDSIDVVHLWGHGTGANGNVRLLISPDGSQPTNDTYRVLLKTCDSAGEDAISNPGAFRLGGLFHLQDGAAIYAYVAFAAIVINVYGYADRIYNG